MRLLSIQGAGARIRAPERPRRGGARNALDLRSARRIPVERRHDPPGGSRCSLRSVPEGERAIAGRGLVRGSAQATAAAVSARRRDRDVDTGSSARGCADDACAPMARRTRHHLSGVGPGRWRGERAGRRDRSCEHAGRSRRVDRLPRRRFLRGPVAVQ